MVGEDAVYAAHELIKKGAPDWALKEFGFLMLPHAG
jgi:hypothetical protein